MLRRLVTAIILTKLGENSAFQVMSLNLLSLFMIMYLIAVKPYQEYRHNIMEIFNEFTVLVCSWLLIMISEFVPDVSTRYMVGWAMICITCSNLMINIGLVVLLSL